MSLKFEFDAPEGVKAKFTQAFSQFEDFRISAQTDLKEMRRALKPGESKRRLILSAQNEVNLLRPWAEKCAELFQATVISSTTFRAEIQNASDMAERFMRSFSRYEQRRSRVQELRERLGALKPGESKEELLKMSKSDLIALADEIEILKRCFHDVILSAFLDEILKLGIGIMLIPKRFKE